MDRKIFKRLLITSFFAACLLSKQFGFADSFELAAIRSPEITKLDLEIADIDPLRQIGLMGKQNLSENEAMLFAFDTKKRLSFWSLGCYLDLQVAFLDQNRVIKEWKFLKAHPEKLKNYPQVTSVKELNILLSNQWLVNFYSRRAVASTFDSSLALELSAKFKPEDRFLVGDVLFLDADRSGWILPTIDLTPYISYLPLTLSSKISCPRSVIIPKLATPLQLTLLDEKDQVIKKVSLPANTAPIQMTLPHSIKTLQLN